jgi:CRP/FNR family transcriptional regulator
VVLSELVAQELVAEREQQSNVTVEAAGEGAKGQLAPDGREDQGSSGEVSGRDVLVTATQADLAQLAGSSRESASRFLAVLERAGVISQGRGRLVVHDPQALKQYVF